MPYKRTGRASGRPKSKCRADGKLQLTAKHWAAIEAEVSLWRKAGAEPTSWPGSVNGAAVARIANLSRMAISKWRRDPLYRQGFWVATGLIAELVKRLDSRPRPAAKKPKLIGRGPKREHRRANLAVFVGNNWPGLVRSPLNGKRYIDVDSYVEHLLDAGAVIVAD